ncbi:MAG: phage holin family protein [Novosphingobium sp.]
MNTVDEQPPSPAADGAAEEAARHRHLEDDLRTLVDRGVALARAEAELQKARASHAAARLKWIALLGGLALALAFFSLVALTVGLVVALTPALGALGATLAVFGGLAIVALLCTAIAVGMWRGLTAALANREAP